MAPDLFSFLFQPKGCGLGCIFLQKKKPLNQIHQYTKSVYPAVRLLLYLFCSVDLRSNEACPWSKRVSVRRWSFFHRAAQLAESVLRGINGGHKLWYGYLNTLNSNWPCSDKDTCSPLRPFPWTELENRNYWFLAAFYTIALIVFY